jgi:hypothetical protein
VAPAERATLTARSTELLEEAIRQEHEAYARQPVRRTHQQLFP